MDVGICLPYSEAGITRKTIADWCRAIEHGPFASLSCGERISGPHALDMRITLGAAAALTSRVRIVPTLYVLPMHNAVWAAKEIATLDLMSDGRVDAVVVGTGGRPNDYRAVGAEWKGREDRLPGQVDKMRQIWRGQLPFEGTEPVGPKPVNSGGPKVLGGFAGPKAITRSAAWADGLYAFSITGEASEITSKFEVFERAWAENKRTGKPRRIGGFWYSLADDSERHLKSYVFDYLKIAGNEVAQAVSAQMTKFTPEIVLETMRGMKAAGIDELFMVPCSNSVAEVERLAPLLAKL